MAVMPATATRFVTRASAAARARSAASVSDVWAVLADPARWADFDPFVRSVVAEDGTPPPEMEAGQHYRAQLRLWQREVPVVVDHVVNRSSVAVTAWLMPGLSEEVEHLVIPSASGGTWLTVRLTLHGPLALPALIPRWLTRTVTVRLLAHVAKTGRRGRIREVSSVA
jgi:hypothetical protein